MSSLDSAIMSPGSARRDGRGAGLVELAPTEVPVPATAAEASLGPEDLRELMRAVNETAEQLERTHVTLRQEVSRLQAELAEANARLRRSRALAALGEMAAGIAHEIRNPLGAIRLNAQMLGEDLAGHPGQQVFCDKIEAGVTALDAIVHDVLQFARDTTVRPAACTVRGLVEHALAQCESLLAGANVRTRRDLPDDERGRLHADAGLITAALANVVRNAVEAMVDAETPEPRLVVSGGRRRVRCPGGSAARRVIIAVEDRGPGVPPEMVERMFNPFFTTRHTGTGLGLAIVHRIVDAHGGHINVEAGAEGGARVELCLPEHPVAAAPEAPLHAGADDR